MGLCCAVANAATAQPVTPLTTPQLRNVHQMGEDVGCDRPLGGLNYTLNISTCFVFRYFSCPSNAQLLKVIIEPKNKHMDIRITDTIWKWISFKASKKSTFLLAVFNLPSATFHQEAVGGEPKASICVS